MMLSLAEAFVRTVSLVSNLASDHGDLKRSGGETQRRRVKRQ